MPFLFISFIADNNDLNKNLNCDMLENNDIKKNPF